jgi:hypothetical protein
MDYIELSQADIDYVDNRAVICWHRNSFIMVDILPLELSEYFINHQRFNYIYENEYKYFLIPLDLVPNIAHYAGFVYQTFPELIFDVVLERQTITVEGVDVDVPVNQIKMIPCNCTHWSDEGVQLLEAVTENWNTSVPNKTINFPVAFESFDLFKAFRDEQIQV